MPKKSKPILKSRKEVMERYPLIFNEPLLKEIDKFAADSTCPKCKQVSQKSIDILTEVCRQRSELDEYRIYNQHKFIEQQQEQIKHLQNKILKQDEYLDNAVNTLPLVMIQNEEIWKERNDFLRAYNALATMGKFAEELGIDIKSKKLPEDQKFTSYYDIFHKHEVLESGKTRYKITLTPKKTDEPNIKK